MQQKIHSGVHSRKTAWHKLHAGDPDRFLLDSSGHVIWMVDRLAARVGLESERFKGRFSSLSRAPHVPFQEEELENWILGLTTDEPASLIVSLLEPPGPGWSITS